MQLKVLVVGNQWLIKSNDEEGVVKGKIKYSRSTNTALFIFDEEKASLKIRRIDAALVFSLSHGSTRVRTILPNQRVSATAILWSIVGQENEGAKVIVKNDSQKILYQNECIAKLKLISEKKAILELFSSTKLPPIILLGLLAPTFFRFNHNSQFL